MRTCLMGVAIGVLMIVAGGCLGGEPLSRVKDGGAVGGLDLDVRFLGGLQCSQDGAECLVVRPDGVVKVRFDGDSGYLAEEDQDVVEKKERVLQGLVDAHWLFLSKMSQTWVTVVVDEVRGRAVLACAYDEHGAVSGRYALVHVSEHDDPYIISFIPDGVGSAFYDIDRGVTVVSNETGGVAWFSLDDAFANVQHSSRRASGFLGVLMGKPFVLQRFNQEAVLVFDDGHVYEYPVDAEFYEGWVHGVLFVAEQGAPLMELREDGGFEAVSMTGKEEEVFEEILGDIARREAEGFRTGN